MKGTRKRYSAAFKAKVALEAAKQTRTLAELSAAYQVHSLQISCEPPTHRIAPKGSSPPPHRLDEGPWVPPAIASSGVGQLFSNV
jgi:hypothetical protein